MYNFECRDNEEFCDNEKMLKKQFIYNLLVAWCVRNQTATNLIEPKMWPLLWMEWQEILHEVGHPHLVRTIRGWSRMAWIRVWHRTDTLVPKCRCEVAHAGQGIWMLLAEYPQTRLRDLRIQLLGLLPSPLVPVCRCEAAHAGQGI